MHRVVVEDLEGSSACGCRNRQLGGLRAASRQRQLADAFAVREHDDLSHSAARNFELPDHAGPPTWRPDQAGQPVRSQHVQCYTGNHCRKPAGDVLYAAGVGVADLDPGLLQASSSASVGEPNTRRATALRCGRFASECSANQSCSPAELTPARGRGSS